MPRKKTSTPPALPGKPVQRHVPAGSAPPPKTTGARSAFDLVAKPAKQPRAERTMLDIAQVQIERGIPMPDRTTGPGRVSKYATLLDRMKPGDMVRLPTKNAYTLMSTGRKLGVKLANRALGEGGCAGCGGWSDMSQATPNDSFGLAFPERDYLVWDPFDGERDTGVRCQQTTLRRARQRHTCFGLLGEQDHEIQSGELYRHEKGFVQGRWGCYRLCIGCMDKWLTEIGRLRDARSNAEFSGPPAPLVEGADLP